MTRVTFTANIQRHVTCPPADVSGRTVREVLDAVWAQNPRARDYVLDDQGAGRHHVPICGGGANVRDRAGLSDEVPAGADIYIMQALSGG